MVVSAWQLENALIQSKCVNRFFDFLVEFWDLVVPNKFQYNWHIEYLCDKLQSYLEDVIDGKQKRADLIINLPPSLGKSTVVSVFFPVYAHIRKPSCRFITSSFDVDLCCEFGRKSLALMQTSKFRQCFGKFDYVPYRQQHYVNQYKGERICCPVLYSPTGKHAHFILIDDAMNPMSIFSEKQQASVMTWMRRVMGSRLVDTLHSPLMLVMQRLSHNDLVAEWESIEKGGGVKLEKIQLPASIEAGQVVLPENLKSRYVNNLLDPIRLNWDAIKYHKAWKTPQDYAAQYDQMPLKTQGLLFNTNAITVKHIDYIADPIVKQVRYWDKAISISQGACETAGALLARHQSGRFSVLDVVHGQWGYIDREQVILDTARKDGVRVPVVIEIEPGSGGYESFQNSVRNLAGFNVKGDKASVAKEMRAVPLAAQMSGGFVDFQYADWNSVAIHQLSQFPHGRLKDIVDAIVGAFNFLAAANVRRAGAL